MSADLEALSREIAATSDKWVVPGMSCVDQVTGAAWRMTAAMAYGWAPDNAIAYGDLENEDSLHRAMAAGPDLTDPVTVNALLEQGQVWQRDGVWYCWISWVVDSSTAATRTEAIARAWISAYKGDQ